MVNEIRPRIAVLDDDPAMCKLLRFHLKQDYLVVMAANGAELDRLVKTNAVDAIVLDIGLPDEDGISIARRIRVMSNIPLVFLSGYASEDMVVKGLNIGADDYVTKPFQAGVLLARLRNALQRGVARASAKPLHCHKFGDISFDEAERLLTSANGYCIECAKLTETESLILGALARAPDSTLSRDELYRLIQGRDWDRMSRELEVHVSNLRRKLEKLGCVKTRIVSLRGTGYCLRTMRETPGSANAIALPPGRSAQ